MLKSHYYKETTVECGCDEAGRGCLAGSVYAAAVILPPDYHNDDLNDSKKLSAKRRYQLREVVERDAVAWAVGIVTAQEIDEINILNASILAMHRAISQLSTQPEAIIVDGNRFRPYSLPSAQLPEGLHLDDARRWLAETARKPQNALPYTTIIKGDANYLSIAAASILAKTFRDDYMDDLAEQYPQYDWKSNKGYPTKRHREAIREYGLTPYHRRSYNLLGNRELDLFSDQ